MHGLFTKFDPILNQKNIIRFHKSEILQAILSNSNTIRLEIFKNQKMKDIPPINYKLSIKHPLGAREIQTEITECLKK